MGAALLAFRLGPAARLVRLRQELPFARRIVRICAATLTLFVLLAGVGMTPDAGAWFRKPVVTPRKPAVTPNTPVTGGSSYLALGDSVTFGYQEPTVVPPPNYLVPSSFIAYPQQLGAGLHLRVTNAACPGETSASLINASARSYACENLYRKVFPLHVRYKGAQLAFAVSFLRSHPDVRLVSLMIGANDVFLCQATTRDACTSPSEQAVVFTTLARNVTRILSAVRNQAHYRGQLAIVNYYSLNYTSPTLNGGSAAINRAMDGAAKRFHVVIADGYNEFKVGSLRSGGNPCTAGLLTQLGGKPVSCGVHPTYAGQALLAQALLKAIRL